MPAAKVDVPVIEGVKDGRWVEVPQTDIFDQEHPAIRINGTNYGPGKHFLSSDLADTVEERIKTYHRASVRVLQPKKDSEAERLVNKGHGESTTQF